MVTTKTFSSDEGGAVIVLATIMISVIVMTAGIAIDFSRANNVRTRMQNIADAAALAAAREVARDPSSNAGSAQATAKAYINASVRDLTMARAIKENVIATNSNVEVSLSAIVPTTLMNVFGWSEMRVAVKSVALPQHGFIRINLVLDISPSMGIGATDADISMITNATGCAVACHYSDVWGGNDNLAQARSSGATMRIDVAKNAIKRILQDLKSMAHSDLIEIGLYTFSNTLMTVEAGTTSLDSAISSVDMIDLTNKEYQGGSNIGYSTKQLADSSKTSGNGFRPDDRIVFTVVLTDGLEDDSMLYLKGGGLFDYMTDPNFKITSPSWLDSANVRTQVMGVEGCQALKSKQHTVLTLELAYIVPKVGIGGSLHSNRFNYIQSIRPDITAKFNTCASKPSYAWKANSPEEIMAAADAIKQSIANGQLRLTQ